MILVFLSSILLLYAAGQCFSLNRITGQQPVWYLLASGIVTLAIFHLSVLYLWLEGTPPTFSNHLEWLGPLTAVGLASGFVYLRSYLKNSQPPKGSFQDLYDKGPDLFFCVDATTRKIIHCNQMALDKTGFSKEELIDMHVMDLYPSESMNRAQETFDKFLKLGKVSNVPMMIKTKSGQCLNISLSAGSVKDEAGNILYSFSVLRDISEIEESHQKIEASNKLIQAVSRAQNQFISEINPNVLFNDLLVAILEVTQSKIGFIGETLWTSKGLPYLKTYFISNIAWDDDSRRLYEENAEVGFEFHNLDSLFGEVLKTGRPVLSNDPENDPRKGGLPPGHPPLNSFLGLPFFHENELVGMVGLANRPQGYDEDLIQYLEPLMITCGNIIRGYKDQKERKSLQKRLRQYSEQLETSNNRLKSFVQVASHDLREPLRKIITFGQMLQPALNQLDPYHAKNLNRILSSTRRMDDLLQGIFMFSQIGQEAPNFKNVDLQPLVFEVLTDNQMLIAERNATVEIGDLPWVRGNASLLRQLFQNLIHNALKFQPPGSQPKISIQSHREGEVWCVEVRDNGIGFDDAHKEKMFELFSRLHPSSDYEGSGLGLAICKQIAEYHSGSLTAQNNAEGGATFILTLPAH